MIREFSLHFKLEIPARFIFLIRWWNSKVAKRNEDSVSDQFIGQEQLKVEDMKITPHNTTRQLDRNTWKRSPWNFVAKCTVEHANNLAWSVHPQTSTKWSFFKKKNYYTTERQDEENFLFTAQPWLVVQQVRNPNGLNQAYFMRNTSFIVAEM